MATTNVHSGETGTPDTGTWTQASAGNNSLLRIESTDQDAQCAVVVSETNGAGIGSSPREITTIYGSDTIFLPAGTYYININIQTNDGSIDAVVDN